MADQCPVERRIQATSGPVPSCPMENKADAAKTSLGVAGLKYNDRASDLVFDSIPEEGQQQRLAVNRVVSTIPKDDSPDSVSPAHQPKDTDKWVYPSEQQYYNAMRRKGYNPDAADIPAVLFIHNAVNERVWSQLREWESFNGNLDPKLKRFMGKPDQLSPKARFLHFIGYSKPFDRHDWIIDRHGREVRYVVDFYTGASNRNHRSSYGSQPPSIYLDVRPALDSVDAALSRASFTLRQRFNPLSLPKWCLQTSVFFQAIDKNNTRPVSATTPTTDRTQQDNPNVK